MFSPSAASFTVVKLLVKHNYHLIYFDSFSPPSIWFCILTLVGRLHWTFHQPKISFFHLVSGSLRGWWNMTIYQTSGTLGQEIATFQRVPLHPSWLIFVSNWSVSRDKVMQIGVWKHMFFCILSSGAVSNTKRVWANITKETIGCSFIPCDSLSVSSWFSFFHCFPWMRFEQENFRTFTWTPPITACSAADWKAGSCFLRRRSLEGWSYAWSELLAKGIMGYSDYGSSPAINDKETAV